MVTMLDIAHRAGVSRSTVSFVLNGRTTSVRISDETRQRILKAADELGYKANAMARVVATGHNPVIGFLAPMVHSSSWPNLLAGMSEAAEEQGHFVKVVVAHHAPDWSQLRDDVINHCIELRLSGVVTHALSDHVISHLHEALLPFGIPVAVEGNPIERPWGISVFADYEQGCGLAIDHLTQGGHQRIAMIGGDRSQGVGRVYEAAFCQALAKRGISVPSWYLQESNWLPHRAQRATELLLSAQGSQPRPTAICCISDEVAMTVLRTARHLGLRVPEQLSVVGWLNSSFSEVTDPPLTTVNEPMAAIGHRLVEHLLTRNAQHRQTSSETKKGAASGEVGEPGARGVASMKVDDNPLREALPMELVVRESTFRARDDL